MAFQALAQNEADCAVEPANLGGIQAVCWAEGMDAGAEERLVGVDIADTGYRALIEQGGLDGRLALCERRGQTVGGESRVERFRAKFRLQAGFGIASVYDHAAEFALIGVAEIGAVGKMNRKVFEPDFRVFSTGKIEVAGHAQVDFDSVASGKIDQQKFSAAADAGHGAADDVGRGDLWFHTAEYAVERADAQSGDGLADDRGFERTTDGFDLGQFWHTHIGRNAAMPWFDGNTAKRSTPGVAQMTSAETCIFCRIVRGDFGTEFLAERKTAVAFRDIDPKAPTHVLVVPRRHLESLLELEDSDAGLAVDLLALANEVARREGIAESGFRVLTNIGEHSGQTVSHLHFHVMGGHRLSAGLG